MTHERLMKKLILLMLLIPSIAFSARLTTDPVDPTTCGGDEQPTCPTTATIYRYTDTTYTDGVIVAEDIPLEADMSLDYNLVDEPAGVNYYKAFHKDAHGGSSKLSNPTVLGSSAPQNLRLSP
jgi:hypothetical protein